jgi:hypothetical protein
MTAWLATTLLLAACTTAASGTPGPSAPGSERPSSEPSMAPSVPPSEGLGEPSSVPSDDGLGEFTCNQALTGGATTFTNITAVRVGQQEGYDRITFEFSGTIPEFRVEPATPPLLQDGSGLPIEVRGDAFLQITLLGATKLAPDGSITYNGPTEFSQDYDELVHLVEGGDFEAVSTWYAGLQTEPCVRVLTLTDPARIAIDIQH